MRVPELAFFSIEGGVDPGRDHVFDSYELGIGVGRVVEDALPDFVIDVGAVVVCFGDAAGVVGVDVEGVAGWVLAVRT